VPVRVASSSTASCAPIRVPSASSKVCCPASGADHYRQLSGTLLIPEAQLGGGARDRGGGSGRQCTFLLAAPDQSDQLLAARVGQRTDQPGPELISDKHHTSHCPTKTITKGTHRRARARLTRQADTGERTSIWAIAPLAVITSGNGVWCLVCGGAYGTITPEALTIADLGQLPLSATLRRDGVCVASRLPSAMRSQYSSPVSWKTVAALGTGWPQQPSCWYSTPDVAQGLGDVPRGAGGLDTLPFARDDAARRLTVSTRTFLSSCGI
jgi:hypothetical protein